MGTLLRKLRGALGTALMWGIGWGIIGLVPGFLLMAPLPGGFSIVLATMAVFAVAGFISGAIFSLLLATLYRRRSLHELRPKRVGAMGMIGAMVLAFVGAISFIGAEGADTPADELLLMLVAGGLGWASAAGAVRIAQAGVGSPDGSGGGDPLLTRDRSPLHAEGALESRARKQPVDPAR